jgi:hypothetical protein
MWWNIFLDCQVFCIHMSMKMICLKYKYKYLNITDRLKNDQWLILGDVSHPERNCSKDFILQTCLFLL